MRQLLLSTTLIAAGLIGPATAGERVDTVAVIRGSESSASHDAGVIVLRPARGSFLAETTRLAARAEAREERLAVERLRASNRALSEALKSVVAGAAATRYGMTNDFIYPYILAARQPVPRRNDFALAPAAFPMVSTPP